MRKTFFFKKKKDLVFPFLCCNEHKVSFLRVGTLYIVQCNLYAKLTEFVQYFQPQVQMSRRF